MSWRRRLLAVAACLPLLMGVTACDGLNGLQGTGDKGYITTDGVVRTVDAAERGDAISYQGEDLDGSPLAIEDYRGTPVVVSVWGSWCTPCRKEAPWVAGAAEALGDGVQFVGINLRDSSTAQASAFARGAGLDFPSLYEPDGEALLAFPGVLGLRSIPSFVVLDREGLVAASIVGQLPSQQTLVDLAQGVVDEAANGAGDG
jgi:thiol-disulfide isomerase/thioredoxin